MDINKLTNRQFEAYCFARKAHEGQFYNSEPYIRHIERVVDNLFKMGIRNEDTYIVGFLHDVVEDCECSLELIEDRFGLRVRDSVDAISRRIYISDDGLDTTRESEESYLSRVLQNTTASLVKWADMSDNLLMSRGVTTPEGKRKLYKKYLNAMKVLAENERF